MKNILKSFQKSVDKCENVCYYRDTETKGGAKMRKFISVLCLTLVCLVFILAIGLIGGYETGAASIGETLWGLLGCGVAIFVLSKICDFIER